MNSPLSLNPEIQEPNYGIRLVGSVFLFCGILYLSLFIGGIEVSIPGLWETPESMQSRLFYQIRLPRVILAIIAGASLSVCGAMVQGIFRNPLVEPALIGISSGAALFAALGIVVLSGSSGFYQEWFGIYSLAVFAFFGAILVSLTVYLLSSKNGKVSVITLLLMGIGVNALCGALMGLLSYYATDAQIRSITFWNLGSLASANWEVVVSILPFAFLPILAIPFVTGGLNALILGEKEAVHLGYSVEVLKLSILGIVCVSVAAIVSVTGIIGFIGLVVPHFTRLVFRSNHKVLLPLSAFLGTALLVFSDWLSRLLVFPSELPIGIITSVIGAPVFLWILTQKIREESFI